jgi:hypothetical protein
VPVPIERIRERKRYRERRIGDGDDHCFSPPVFISPIGRCP